MPGLPKRPAAENIDLTDEGIITLVLAATNNILFHIVIQLDENCDKLWYNSFFGTVHHRDTEDANDPY